IVHFPFTFIYRTWNLLFSRIYECKETWKMLFNFIEFSTFLLFYKTYQVLISTVLPNLLSFEYLYGKCYFGLGQTEESHQLGYRLCKDDNKLKSLEICLLNPV
ncbi:MAG TPA: hypothetical protein VN703_01210, partial [Candidatus Sulfopaludibacter sp.]|nr:hypothetical protein [Candidatus Sulfopaludibacter sp.]